MASKPKTAAPPKSSAAKAIPPVKVSTAKPAAQVKASTGLAKTTTAPPKPLVAAESEEESPPDAMAQASAQAAIYGAQATEAMQGLLGGLNDWLGTANPPPKKSKKPVTAPLKVSPDPVPPPAVIPKKPAISVQKPVVSTKTMAGAKAVSIEKKYDIIETFQQPKEQAPPRDPNASPRQRPPGKPPVSSSQELRNETNVPTERDDELIVLKRDLIVNAVHPTPLMPFTTARKPITRLHPSVTPRQEGLSTEETALISDLVDDPISRRELSGVDKIIHSRQFIDAMRKSLERSKDQGNNLPRSDRFSLPLSVGDRPISPVQENISTVAFLPLPYDMCRRCGLYQHSCVCSGILQISPAMKLRRGLQRSIDKVDSPDSVPSDDENTLESIPEKIYLRSGATFRGEVESNGIRMKKSAFLANFKEKFEFNQFWFSELTVGTIVQELKDLNVSNVAFLSTPSVFFAALEQNIRGILFDKDDSLACNNRSQFVKYDFEEFEIPSDLLGCFDAVVVDPPFITSSVMEAFALTVSKLILPRGKIIWTSTAENENALKAFLGNDITAATFKPSIPSLVYQYNIYVNYEIDSSSGFSSSNPELSLF